jgi:hypothetical protein
MAAIKETIDTVSNLMEVVEEAKDRGISSLSEYTKQTLITSRVYIEDIISGEPTVLNILKLCNQIYAGMVFCALGLNNVISGGRTVRQMLGAVATEDVYKSVMDMVKDFGDAEPSTEANEDKQKSNDQKDNFGIKDVKIETDASKLFTGRLLEANLGSGQNTAKLYFFIQMLPKILPGLVLDQFIGNHIEPSKALRWAQWKAGEIKFWRDFVFEADRIAKRKKALKLDKDGILREVEDTRDQGFFKKLWNWIKPNTVVTNHNAANSMILISKQRMDRICRDNGIKLENFQQRQKLMSELMTLMIVVYDPSYETIDLFMNGIQNYGQYNAKMVEAATKKDDGVDLKQVMTLIAAGSAPKF